MVQYLNAYKTAQNVYALWEEHTKTDATIICNADGTPAKALHVKKSVEKTQRACIPVKKGQYVLRGHQKGKNNEITIYCVVYPFTNNHGSHLVKAQQVCACKNGYWDGELPKCLLFMFRLLMAKMNGQSDRIAASVQQVLPVKKVKNGKFALWESCGRDESTIVCTSEGLPAQAIRICRKDKGATGRQALALVFPHNRILRGRKTDEGTEISVYKVIRAYVDKGGPHVDVDLINHCIADRWEHDVPRNLRDALKLLKAKIAEKDTETIFSHLKHKAVC